MKVYILTPEWSRTVDDVTAAFIPGALGPFEVLHRHAPMISTLAEGNIVLRSAAGEETITVKSGAVSIKNDEIRLCVEI